MATRKSPRISRSHHTSGSAHRKRLRLLPLLEGLENRVILSRTLSIMPPNVAVVAATDVVSTTNIRDGLVPVNLANGTTAWMEGSTVSTLRLPASAGSSAAAGPPAQPALESIPGAILGSLPVSSPFDSAGSQYSAGPAGYIPEQLQTAYGLSTGSGYNNEVSFGAIKGNGAGQTIGIYEEGYDPAFVDTSDPTFSSSALAVFDKTFGLPDPPSLTFVDHTGAPMSVTNNSSNNPDFQNYGAGVEIALDIEWAHAMAPAASIVVLCAVPEPNNYYEDIPLGIATLAGLPGVSVISASYAWYLDDFGVESLEQSWDSTIIAPALAANPNVSVFAATGDNGAYYGATYPSSSPEVVGVGGTSLYLTPGGQWSEELGWDEGGGGYSQAFTLPAYQQADGFAGNVYDQRTTPDVAADANANTGVAVFDPYDFGKATPWAEVGGTSLATPLWAGMAAIIDQGRAAAGGKSIGSTTMLSDLYELDNLAPGDFHDVTQGNNGYQAGPGYDLVTGLGTPKANLLFPALAALGQASKASIFTQPPPSVVTGATFGIIAAATDSLGITDQGYNGTATLTLASGPSGATFKPVTVPVTDGLAVFPNLSLGSKKGSGYTFRVSMTSLASSLTTPTAVVAPQSNTAYFYPFPFSNGLNTAIAAADSNGDANEVITLAVSSVPYEVTAGQLLIENSSSLKSKSFTITGQGETSSVIAALSTSRVFEIVGTNSLSVSMGSLAISGGRAANGGILGGSAALGGGLLIDGGNVALSNVAVMGNAASGAAGAGGAAGISATAGHPTGGPGGKGSAGSNALGGGIYLGAGTLTLTSDVIEGNVAQGGAGGAGGRGGYGFTVYQTSAGSSFIGSFHAGNAGNGGAGGAGGNGYGGGLYIAAGSLAPLESGVVIEGNSAEGGAGGDGGTGGRAGLYGHYLAGNGGAAGPGGDGAGGGIFLGSASVQIYRPAVIENNNAVGGAGGHGGDGGSGALGAPGAYGVSGGPGGNGGNGYTGGNAGAGGAGGWGHGGGIYVPGGGVLELNAGSSLTGNVASGGAGGDGGDAGSGGPGGAGGAGGFGAAGALGGGVGQPGGKGGDGGNAGHAGLAADGGYGGSGAGGGVFIGGGLVQENAGAAIASNIALGGAGGVGGHAYEGEAGWPGSGGPGGPGGTGTAHHPTGGKGGAGAQPEQRD